MQNITNCGDESQIIKFINSSMKTTDNCGMASSSCSSLKPYNKTEVVLQGFDYHSNIMMSDVKFDLCDKKKKPDNMKMSLRIFGVPLQCSSKTSTVFCYNPSKTLPISSFLQKMIPLIARNGKVRTVLKMNHDTGTSCMSALMTFTKKSKP